MKIAGKKVVDAKKSISITVNQGDINRGKSKKPDQCAIACACMRQRAAQSARVHLSRTYIEYPDKWVRYRTPSAARTEIVSFDRGHKFEVGEFVLHPVCPSDIVRMGARQGTSVGDKRTRAEKRKAVPRKMQHITGVRASAHKNIWSAKNANK